MKLLTLSVVLVLALAAQAKQVIISSSSCKVAMHAHRITFFFLLVSYLHHYNVVLCLPVLLG